MLKILLSGACGRMGRQVVACAEETDTKIIAGVDVHPQGNADFPVYPSFELVKEEAQVIVDFTRPVAARLESEDEDEEYLLIGEGGVINVDEAITEELLLSLPFRSLCKDDCLGLCPKCGCNKNEKDCGCVLKEPDPRFAILKTVKFRDE